MSNKYKTEMYNTNNDTPKWALIIDGFLQLFDSKKDLDVVYNLAMQNSEGYIDNTNFSDIEVLSPGEKIEYIDGTFAYRRISEISQINLTDYINKSIHRSKIKCSQPEDPLMQRQIKGKGFQKPFNWENFLN